MCARTENSPSSSAPALEMTDRDITRRKKYQKSKVSYFAYYSYLLGRIVSLLLNQESIKTTLKTRSLIAYHFINIGYEVFLSHAEVNRKCTGPLHMCRRSQIRSCDSCAKTTVINRDKTSTWHRQKVLLLVFAAQMLCK